jgi:hypothetical protein
MPSSSPIEAAREGCSDSLKRESGDRARCQSKREIAHEGLTELQDVKPGRGG